MERNNKIFQEIFQLAYNDKPAALDKINSYEPIYGEGAMRIWDTEIFAAWFTGDKNRAQKAAQKILKYAENEGVVIPSSIFGNLIHPINLTYSLQFKDIPIYLRSSLEESLDMAINLANQGLSAKIIDRDVDTLINMFENTQPPFLLLSDQCQIDAEFPQNITVCKGFSTVSLFGDAEGEKYLDLFTRNEKVDIDKGLLVLSAKWITRVLSDIKTCKKLDVDFTKTLNTKEMNMCLKISGFHMKKITFHNGI